MNKSESTTTSKSEKFILVIFFTFILVFVFGLIIPERLTIPVDGAYENDWNHQSFWFYPWSPDSLVHKGIDIFAEEGTPVLSATDGIVLSARFASIAGNYVYILGPKWRVHYYAHMKEIKISRGHFVFRGTQIGTVGNTGNASRAAPHLHYSIFTLIPYFWRWDDDVEGWQKMFYLNPHEKLIELAHQATERDKGLVRRLCCVDQFRENQNQVLKKGTKIIPIIGKVLAAIPSENIKALDDKTRDDINLARNALVLLGKIGGVRAQKLLQEWIARTDVAVEIHAAAELGLKLLNNPEEKEEDDPHLLEIAIDKKFKFQNVKTDQ